MITRSPRMLCSNDMTAVVLFSSRSPLPPMRAASRSIFTPLVSRALRKNMSILVSAPEVMRMAQNEANSLVFIDASWHLDKSRDAEVDYICERIPDACFLDIDDVAEKASTLPHMLPSKRYFEACMDTLLRLRREDTLVIYTAPGSFSAARAWWMFRVFGHPKVHVLDGGLNAWKAVGGAVEAGPPTHFQFEREYVAEYNEKLVASREQVVQAMQTGRAQIVDARSSARFNGEAPEPRPNLPSGHIPGSLNVPATSLLDPNDVTKFKSKEEMRAVLEEAGVVLGANVLCTCGSGVTAAVIALALNEVGVKEDQVAVYDGSWCDWGSCAELPKVTR